MVVEKVLGEDTFVDVVVRYIEFERDGEVHFWAAGAPLDDEWCFLARAEFLAELEIAARAIVEQVDTREIFLRMAALTGVPWNDGQMVPLLESQDRGARELMRKAPGVAEADIDELRRTRKLAGEDLGSEN